MAVPVQIRPDAGPAAAPRPGRLEIALAVAAFVVLCVVTLRTAPQLVEPDDYAYRASIVGITDGHLLTLTTAQMQALAHQLTQTTGGRTAVISPGSAMPGIAQWSRLAGGRWISEKDPGYPFLAAPFQLLGIIRLAPLFYGALACLGLFAGARRWLGRSGGAVAVGLFCSSGAALLFAWRDYMPTFTDASLIAAGTGALLWAVLAGEASPRRRIVTGLAGFLAFEAAVFTRYTNIVVLGCAVLALLVLRWRRPGILPTRAVPWWVGSAVLFVAGAGLFNTLVYGGPLRSGYRPGEIRFSLSAVLPNLRLMPRHLIEAMPVLVLGFAALIWIGVRWLRLRQSATRRDAAIALALGASWLSVWGLYAAYAWTALPGLSTLQSVRFYLPAIGPIALLGAWALTHVPLRKGLAATTLTAVVALFGLGVWSFTGMTQFRLGPGHVKPPAGRQAPGSRQPGGPPGQPP